MAEKGLTARMCVTTQRPGLGRVAPSLPIKLTGSVGPRAVAQPGFLGRGGLLDTDAATSRQLAWGNEKTLHGLIRVVITRLPFCLEATRLPGLERIAAEATKPSP
jgi:hypothetical protein